MNTLNDEYILQNIDKFNLEQLSADYITTEEQIDKFFDFIDWDTLLSKLTLSDAFMMHNIEKLNWNIILRKQCINEDILNYLAIQYGHIYIFWDTVSKYQQLSDTFMHKYFHELLMNDICTTRQISEKFLQDNITRVHVPLVCKFQLLSEQFIERNIEHAYMDVICKYQILSEQFIEKHYKLVHWDKIARYQQFSFEFMIRYSDELYPYRNENTRAIAKRKICVWQLCGKLNSDICKIIESMLPIEASCIFV